MPPILSRKRLRTTSPTPEPSSKRTRITTSSTSGRGKQSVFQALDTPPTISRTLSQTKLLLEEGDDDESELSDAQTSEDEFEDVPTGSKTKGKAKVDDANGSTESEEDDWEDALVQNHHPHHDHAPAPDVSGDLELTLSSTAAPAAFSSKSDGKKGPSKIEREIRNVTHCMHVQLLMFHNLIRNSWVEDKQVQAILVEKLNTGGWREIDAYWRNPGISNGHDRVVKGAWSKRKAKETGDSDNWKASGKKGVELFANPEKSGAPSKKGTKNTVPDKQRDNARISGRNQRDWGAASDRLEPNTPDLSSGDPLLRLLKYLAAFWKSRFKVTEPSLRKRGYLAPSTLEGEVATWRDHPSHAEAFGERVESVEVFREKARKCQGSRDVGQQLFTALLRALGIEARMVASLQPVGFGWSQVEEGKAKDLEKLKSKEKGTGKGSAKPSSAGTRQDSHTMNGTKAAPIDLEDDDTSGLSSAVSLSSDSEIEEDVVKKSPKAPKYNEDLPYPTYWTEAISPLTHTPISLSVLPRPVIATSSMAESLLHFYCRGAAADKAKQVFAYIVAFSSDGSAKDVTTRYLPKHQWPGKTKGFRLPAEKIPIYNKHGKVAKWEEFDWWKSVLRPYSRNVFERQPWDDVEDEGDLVPAKPTKPKGMDEEGGKETLQGYKNSAEYVLERHLRREEALKPEAKIVRHFTTGKGDNEKKEPVYRRKDIVICKTVESWHKEGRAIKEGQQPLKYVPMRAVTVTRKREMEEREREEGEKVKQGLYSKAQTEWIIPDPIVDGRIPRNAFGNIDVYVPTMIPQGSVHIPLKGTVRVCKKLGIDYAEACTGFEFGKQRAVPILTGVVVAAENKDLVIDAWKAEETEKAKKEHQKKEKLVLGLWKKFFVGLRIVKRMKLEYGDDTELPAVEENDHAQKKSEWEVFRDHADFEGGFVREEPSRTVGYVRHEAEHQQSIGADAQDTAGGFLLSSQEDSITHVEELAIEYGDHQESRRSGPATENTFQTPMSLHSALRQQPDGYDEHEAEDEGLNASQPTQRQASRPSQGKARASRGRGHGPGRGSGLTRLRDATPRSDQVVQKHDEQDSSLSSPCSPAASDSETDLDEPRLGQSGKRKVSASPPARAVPKRDAARKTDAKVKSHFFDHGSDEETDKSPAKRSAARTGRGRAKGRSRGRRGAN